MLKSMLAALALVVLGGAALADPPSAATMALARRAAAGDDFLFLVQMKGGAEIGEIEKGLGTLAPDEKAKVDAIGKAKLAEGSARVIDRLAQAYAARFTPDQLASIAQFVETPAGKAYSARLLAVLPALGESMKGFDFKREVLKQTCAELKKGC
ncbi:MAG TPA: DUF2059 domain-containing protein [Caulobacteraceae bacterium]|jgi:hypothetical protein|nr:DUF2059 domain-containing protein [Caulobacteraceae bacterium]